MLRQRRNGDLYFNPRDPDFHSRWDEGIAMLHRLASPVRTVLGTWLVLSLDQARSVLASDAFTRAYPDQAAVEPPVAGRASGAIEAIRSSIFGTERDSDRQVRSAMLAVAKAGRSRRNELLVSEATSIVSQLAADRAIDLIGSCVAPYVGRTLCLATGLSPGTAPMVAGFTRAMVPLIDSAYCSHAVIADADAARERLTRAVADDHRPAQSGDLPDRLARLIRSGAISQPADDANRAIFLAAGYETTVGAIAAALHILADHPSLNTGLLAGEIDFDSFFDEVLRLASPISLVVRRAVRDTAIGARAVHAGDLVYVMIGAANRDPAAFADPDRFSLTRIGAQRPIPFGGGRHYCVGEALARAQAHCLIVALLGRFSGIQIEQAASGWHDAAQFHVPTRLVGILLP